MSIYLSRDIKLRILWYTFLVMSPTPSAFYINQVRFCASLCCIQCFYSIDRQNQLIAVIICNILLVCSVWNIMADIMHWVSGPLIALALGFRAGQGQPLLQRCRNVKAIHPSTYTFVQQSFCLICLSFQPCIHLCVHSFVHPSIHSSINVFFSNSLLFLISFRFRSLFLFCCWLVLALLTPCKKRLCVSERERERFVIATSAYSFKWKEKYRLHRAHA